MIRSLRSLRAYFLRTGRAGRGSPDPAPLQSRRRSPDLRQRQRPLKLVATSATLILLVATNAQLLADPLSIDVPERDAPVDFEREALPILTASCVACHNEKKSEAGLSLETREAMLKGGDSGPALVPGDADRSLLFLAASHQGDSPMPPAENDVAAKDLSPRELGLLKLWIDQGAVAQAAKARAVAWKPLPKTYRPIFALAVTPDGQFGACARGNELCIYHLPTGTLAATLVDPALSGPEGASGAPLAHRDVIRSLAFDVTGDRLASGAFREAKIWRRPRLTKLAEKKFDAPGVFAAVSRDGTRVAVADDQGKIRLWKFGSPDEVRTIERGEGATVGLAFSADGATLFAASARGNVSRCNAESGEAVGSPIETKVALKSMALDDSGAFLATGGEDGKIRLWKLEDLAANDGSSAAPPRVIDPQGKAVTTLVARPGSPGKFLSGDADGRIAQINAESGEVSDAYWHDAPIDALAIRPNGERVVSVGGGYVLVRDGSFKELDRLDADPRLDAEVERIDSQIAFVEASVELAKNDIKSYEGAERRVMTTEEAIKKAEEEKTKAEKTRDEKKEAAEKAKDDEKKKEAADKALAEAETAVAVAQTVIDRAKVVHEKAKETFAAEQEAVKQNEAKLDELKAAKSAAEETRKNAKPTFTSVAFSADSSRLFVGCEDGTVHAFTHDEPSPIEFVPAGASAVRSLVAGGAALVALAADGTAATLEARSTWTLERTIGGENNPSFPLSDRVLALDFSPDGTRLAIGGGVPARQGELFLWDLEANAVVADYSLPHADTIFAARFSPDGSRLATGCGDRMVRILDAATGEVRHVLAGHTAHVLSVSWRGDGSQVVTAGVDRMLKLWNADDGTQVRSMKGTTYQIGAYKDEVAAATFIGESEQIFAASGDGTVRLHRASSEGDMQTERDSAGHQYAVAVSPDGSALLAGGEDGILRQWKRRDGKPARTYAP